MMQAVNLIKYLLEQGLDNRIMNNIRIDFLSKIQSEYGYLKIDDFLKMFRTISKLNNSEMEEKVVDFCKDSKTNVIKYSKFSEFVDFYQYLPMHIKKDRNLSKELYYILTSNKFSNHGEKYQTEQDQMGLKESLDFLWLKIEERFHKVANAFRFFDINNNSTIQIKEFEIGVHKLSTRFSREIIKKMFDYIDTDNDGNIKYIEFCELCDECRRGIDPYKVENKLKGGESSSRPNKSSLSMTNSFRKNSKKLEQDDDVISDSLASFKRKKKYSTILPSQHNNSYSYGIKSPESENISSIMTYEPLNQYLNDCKVREEKILGKNKSKDIFKRAKPTYSSSVRDNALKQQRDERNQRFMSDHVGYLKMKQLKNQTGSKPSLGVLTESHPPKSYKKGVNKSVIKPISNLSKLIEAKKHDMINLKQHDDKKGSKAVKPSELYK